MVGGQRVKIERIAVSNIETARQPEFSPNANRKRTAVDEDGGAGMMRRQLDDRTHGRIVQ
jgi:hypothetical protein